MKYQEFEHLKQIEDQQNPFSTLFELDTGERFYIEPVFYTMFKGFKDHHPDKIPLIVEAMLKAVRENKKVVFTGNYECPLTEADDYIYLEINDITDPLKIFVEDKSRGSDYGD